MSRISRHARIAVAAVPRDEKTYKTFRNRADEMSARIVHAGLPTAMAYLRTKGDAPALYNALTDWIARTRSATEAASATDTVLDYLNWLRYLAKSEAKMTQQGGGYENANPAGIPSSPNVDVAKHNKHAGLMLDKWTRPGDQKQQKESLERVRGCDRDEALFAEALEQRNVMMTAINARQWECRTTTPFTLHLSRNAALENAGICLHPVYGFVYMPGTGLKGMARAYAETVWLPLQPQPQQAEAEEKILTVFGNERAERSKGKIHSGCIVFHEAWPVKPPSLHVDIVNNHHKSYYEDGQPPGDWDNPEPSYFLAVAPGETYCFALSTLKQDADPACLELAQQWLVGALMHLGAGAKTSAGYGFFEPLQPVREVPDKLPDVKYATFDAVLKLVTPAFFSGADQTKQGGCDLRSATLRGLLRWWWRTMHAGHLKTETLRNLESAVWGDTEASGAVKCRIERIMPGVIEKCPFKGADSRTDPNFLRRNGIPGAVGRTTQPLIYMSYGMDEKNQGARKQRYVCHAGAQWRVRLVASSVKRPQFGGLTVQQVLEQAQAALWLLCTYGGAGSRARKGFGSLSLEGESNYSRARCQDMASAFRLSCGLVDDGSASTPSLEEMMVQEVEVPWTNPWYLVDKLGAVLSAFAQAPSSTGHGKHCPKKVALGLPRKIHGPLPSSATPPKELSCSKGNRYASPIHHHVGKLDNGKFCLRVALFTSKWLPDIGTSREILGEYANFFIEELEQLKSAHPDEGKLTSSAPQNTATEVPDGLPSCGQTVDAEIVSEPAKSGATRARLVGHDIVGVIQNWKELPPDITPGKRVRLMVRINKPDNFAFAWPVSVPPKPPKQKRKK